mgnify:CR=1 FL=1
MRNRYLIFIALLFGILTASGQGLNWVHEIDGGPNGWVSIRDMAIDASGNVTAFGSFSGTADFDPGTGTTTKTSAGSSDIFIAKYGPDAISGVKSSTLQHNLQLYPNPFDDKIQLVLQKNERMIAASVFDMHGRSVWHAETIQHNSGQLDLSFLPPGQYIIRLRTTVGTRTASIIKK